MGELIDQLINNMVDNVDTNDRNVIVKFGDTNIESNTFEESLEIFMNKYQMHNSEANKASLVYMLMGALLSLPKTDKMASNNVQKIFLKREDDVIKFCIVQNKEKGEHLKIKFHLLDTSKKIGYHLKSDDNHIFPVMTVQDYGEIYTLLERNYLVNNRELFENTGVYPFVDAEVKTVAMYQPEKGKMYSLRTHKGLQYVTADQNSPFLTAGARVKDSLYIPGLLKSIEIASASSKLNFIQVEPGTEFYSKNFEHLMSLIKSGSLSELHSASNRAFVEMVNIFEKHIDELALERTQGSLLSFIQGAIILNFQQANNLECTPRYNKHGQWEGLNIFNKKFTQSEWPIDLIPLVVRFVDANDEQWFNHLNTADNILKSFDDTKIDLPVKSVIKDQKVIAVNINKKRFTEEAHYVKSDNVNRMMHYDQIDDSDIVVTSESCQPNADEHNLIDILLDFSQNSKQGKDIIETLNQKLMQIQNRMNIKDVINHYMSEFIFGQLLSSERDDIQKYTFTYKKHKKDLSTFILKPKKEKHAIILNLHETLSDRTKLSDTKFRKKELARSFKLAFPRFGSSMKVNKVTKFDIVLSIDDLDVTQTLIKVNNIEVDNFNMKHVRKAKGKFTEISNLDVAKLLSLMQMDSNTNEIVNGITTYEYANFHEYLLSQLKNHESKIRSAIGFQAFVHGTLSDYATIFTPYKTQHEIMGIKAKNMENYILLGLTWHQDTQNTQKMLEKSLDYMSRVYIEDYKAHPDRRKVVLVAVNFNKDLQIEALRSLTKDTQGNARHEFEACLKSHRRKRSTICGGLNKAEYEKFSDIIENKYKDVKKTIGEKVSKHLRKAQNYAGMLIHGQIAKNILLDFIQGDYKDIAMNTAFFSTSAFSGKLGEYTNALGTEYSISGRAILGKTLSSAAPFLARSGSSAFVIYDLVTQISSYKNGNVDAILGIATDSAYVALDVAEIGIELAEVYGLIGEISAFTGPIGAALGAAIFVGTEIYAAVETVQQIDKIIHLSTEEKFEEGWRAFLHLKAEQYIEKLIEERQLNEALIKEGHQFLHEHPEIHSYIFPGLEKYETDCIKTRKPVYMNQRLLTFSIARVEIKCSYKSREMADNLINLSNRAERWSRIWPDMNESLELLCLGSSTCQRPEAPHRVVLFYWMFPFTIWPLPLKFVYRDNTYELSTSNWLFTCDNSIGLRRDLNSEKGGYAMVRLGYGTDNAVLFEHSRNIVSISDGKKLVIGGDESDIFVLHGMNVTGTLYGNAGSNLLNLANYGEGRVTRISYMANNLASVKFLTPTTLSDTLMLQNINKVQGKKNVKDIVVCSCHTEMLKLQGGGGRDEKRMDEIIVPYANCMYNIQFDIEGFMKITNGAQYGKFVYKIERSNGRAIFNLVNTNSSSNVIHNFYANYALKDIFLLNATDKTNDCYKFHLILQSTEGFYSLVFELNAYLHLKLNLVDDTVVNMHKDTVYVFQNSTLTNFSDVIIQEYRSIADRLGIILYIYLHVKKWSILIGHGIHTYKDKAMSSQNTKKLNANILPNDPNLRSVLVCGNTENIFIVKVNPKTVEWSLQHDGQYFFLQQVTIYFTPDSSMSSNQSSKFSNPINTVDFSQLVEQTRKALNNTEVKLIMSPGPTTHDLSIHIYITEDGEVDNQIFIGHVILKHAMINHAYESIIVNRKAPMTIKFGKYGPRLVPKNVHMHNKSILILSARDTEPFSKIIVPKFMGQLTFLKMNFTLIMTNVISTCGKPSEPQRSITDHDRDWYTIILHDFYNEPDLRTLKLAFNNDTKVKLKNRAYEIMNAKNFSDYVDSHALNVTLY